MTPLPTLEPVISQKPSSSQPSSSSPSLLFPSSIPSSSIPSSSQPSRSSPTISFPSSVSSSLIPTSSEQTLVLVPHSTINPTDYPSQRPMQTLNTKSPTQKPPIRYQTQKPTRVPTMQPSRKLSNLPTSKPTRTPTGRPSRKPSQKPTTRFPTTKPSSRAPTKTPTRVPTKPPTRTPTKVPTVSPTMDATLGLPNPICNAGTTSIITNAEMCILTNLISIDFTSHIQELTPLQKSKLFGPALRLAFHDAGEIDLTLPDDLLGPDGCLSSSPDHNGLIESTSVVNTVIEQMWQKYCTKISRADFWAYFGKLVIETATQPVLTSVKYYFGRKDNVECAAGAGRLFDALNTKFSASQEHFSTNMGLSLEETVTLIGAHSVGHMSPLDSGFGRNPVKGLLESNAWDRTPDKLDNQYFLDIMGITWDLARENQDPTRFHLQDFIDDRSERVMLNTDMNMVFDIDPQNSGVPSIRKCGGARNKCSRVEITRTVIEKYTNTVTGNAEFVKEFSLAYTKMMNVGYGFNGSSGKLGELTALEC